MSRRISQEVATEGMAAEISSDVDSEAPAETTIQVGVSSQEVITERKILVSEHVTITVTLNHRSVMAWLRNRNFESPFRDGMATQP